MSYCRWSSEDYQCDLYVYEGEDGVSVNVASARHVIDLDALPPLDGTVPAMIARHGALMSVIDSEKMMVLNLPSDGDCYYGLDYEEALSHMIRLKEEGYNVPEYAIEAMREECDDD